MTTEHEIGMIVTEDDTHYEFKDLPAQLAACWGDRHNPREFAQLLHDLAVKVFVDQVSPGMLQRFAKADTPDDIDTVSECWHAWQDMVGIIKRMVTTMPQVNLDARPVVDVEDNTPAPDRATLEDYVTDVINGLCMSVDSACEDDFTDYLTDKVSVGDTFRQVEFRIDQLVSDRLVVEGKHTRRMPAPVTDDGWNKCDRCGAMTNYTWTNSEGSCVPLCSSCTPD